ncbi:MAG: type IV toxin-antitoxin system AbiEi family antitoxin domain-containing protein [Thermoleophilaceae bacterium]
MAGRVRTVERVIARVAHRAHGVVTREELRAAGVSDDEIDERIESGSLIPVHRGVYRVGHQAPSLEATYIAAVKACGDGAQLSGLAGAYFYGLIKQAPAEPEVTAPTERKVAGVLVHRARAGIDPRETTVWRGIPMTTVPRTLVDIAGRLSDEQLARACHEAAVRFRVKPDQVEKVLVHRPNVAGAGRLRAILNGDTPTSLSKLESAFIELLRKHKLPLPRTNERVGSHRVDCRWPELKLTIELDSYAFHNRRYSWQQDRKRDREARRRGDRIVRYTWTDLEETADELRRLLAQP